LHSTKKWMPVVTMFCAFSVLSYGYYRASNPRFECNEVTMREDYWRPGDKCIYPSLVEGHEYDTFIVR
jgi:hypothetical protein